MSWRRIRPLIVAFMATFLLIFVTGVAVANNENNIQIFKMNVRCNQKLFKSDSIS